MVEDFSEELNDKKARTPANDNLFKVKEGVEKISESKGQEYHTFTAKALFACKRARPDIQTSVAFLTTRVVEPAKEDWKKVLQMMNYIKKHCAFVFDFKSRWIFHTGMVCRCFLCCV